MEHLQDSVDEFTQVALSQEKKGIQKYGQPLNPLDNYCWLDMASQELVDGFKYLHAEQVKRADICAKIRRLVDKPEVLRLLDELEGRK